MHRAIKLCALRVLSGSGLSHACRLNWHATLTTSSGLPKERVGGDRLPAGMRSSKSLALNGLGFAEVLSMRFLTLSE